MSGSNKETRLARCVCGGEAATDATFSGWYIRHTCPKCKREITATSIDEAHVMWNGAMSALADLRGRQ